MKISNDKSKIELLFSTWRGEALLSASFPLKLRNGGEVETFSGYCANCDAEIPDADLHGSIAVVVPTVADITAIGLCRECSCLTPFFHRIRAVGGGIQSEWVADDGRWVKRAWTCKPGLGTLTAWLRSVSGWFWRAK